MVTFSHTNRQASMAHNRACYQFLDQVDSIVKQLPDLSKMELVRRMEDTLIQNGEDDIPSDPYKLLLKASCTGTTQVYAKATLDVLKSEIRSAGLEEDVTIEEALADAQKCIPEMREFQHGKAPASRG